MSHLRPLSMIGGIICIDFADQLLSETAVHGLSTGPWFFGSCSKPFSSLNLYPCCLRNDRKRVKWCLGGYILLSTTKGKIERRLREGQKKKESVVLVNTHSCPHPLVYSWWANGFQHFEREEKKVQKKKKKILHSVFSSFSPTYSMFKIDYSISVVGMEPTLDAI